MPKMPSISNVPGMEWAQDYAMGTAIAGASTPESAGIKAGASHETHDRHSTEYHKMKEIGFTKIPPGHVSSCKPPETDENTVYVTIKMSNNQIIAENTPFR